MDVCVVIPAEDMEPAEIQAAEDEEVHHRLTLNPIPMTCLLSKGAGAPCASCIGFQHAGDSYGRISGATVRTRFRVRVRVRVRELECFRLSSNMDL
jgi:hypothetical protein